MSPIADMLSQIKNAQARGLESVSIPHSELKFKIAEVLRENGYIGEVEKKKKKENKAELPFLAIKLKYDNGVGVINGIKLVSKPSRRLYSGKSGLKPVRSGYGVAIVSTSHGVMTGTEAKKKGIGGEMLFEIW